MEPLRGCDRDRRRRSVRTSRAFGGKYIVRQSRGSYHYEEEEEVEEYQDPRGLRREHLVQRHVAAEEVHRVLQRASAGELDRVECAVGLEHPRHVDAFFRL